ncbi:hypothetical protein [Porphyromonas circumdentaria]|uniref:hypothetical protein n=1 Tax=Porphyromonas circumdentaria TaxID=29524 RepID=UPI0026DD5BB6|nr:hypothetical protein [Porphyromonas circumdentaria]MDO4723007.1 hypothetical protein [Porphyromonas circumdentaria]
MKHKFQFWSLSLLLLLTSAIGYAQQAVRPAAQMLSSNGPAEVTPSREARIEGNYSYVDFDVEAPVSQEYYISFWVNPYLDIEGNLPTYHVFVDGRACGLINPTSPDPHSVNISTDKVYLSSGKHQISVRAVVPDIAGVELMKVSNTAPSARLSSSAYSEYLQAVQDIQAGRMSAERYLAQQRSTLPLEQENWPEALPLNQMQRNSGEFYSFVPAPYTFRGTRYFNAGSLVLISSSSTTPHVIYLVSSDVNTPPLMNQGLTWLRYSSQVPGNNQHTALFAITIPKTGTYQVVARTLAENTFGTINVNINQEYFYNDRPISFSYIASSMPYNRRLLSMAKGIRRGNELVDPYLYVLGGGSCPGLIVQYNDDVAQGVDVTAYGIHPRDSFIDATYRMPTCGLLATNCWSYTPLIYCHIITNLEYTPIPFVAPQTDLLSANSVSTPAVRLVQGEGTPRLQLSSEEEIESIEVFNYATQTRVHTSSLSRKGEVELIASEVGLCTPGIYLISLHSATGTTTHKVTLR